MTLQFNPNRSNAASTYGNLPHLGKDNAGKENPAQSIVDNLGYGTFKEKGSIAFANYLIDEEAAKLTYPDQEVFLEKVVDKLLCLNIDLQDMNDDLTPVNKEDFREWVADIENQLSNYVYTLSFANASDQIGEEKLLQEQISKVQNQFQRSSSPVVANAYGEKFTRKNDVVKNGNCGLNAAFQATEKLATQFDEIAARRELVKIKDAHTRFHVANFSPAAVKEDDLKLIFGNVDNCKHFLEARIDSLLANSDLENREKFIALKNQITSIHTFKDIIKNPELLRRLDFDFTFSKSAHINGDNLTEGDLKALMLSKGHDCVDEGIRKDGKKLKDEPSAPVHTILQFKHLSTGAEAYIANDSRPLPHTETMKQSIGSHWFCAEKVPAPQI